MRPPLCLAAQMGRRLGRGALLLGTLPARPSAGKAGLIPSCNERDSLQLVRLPAQPPILSYRIGKIGGWAGRRRTVIVSDRWYDRGPRLAGRGAENACWMPRLGRSWRNRATTLRPWCRNRATAFSTAVCPRTRLAGASAFLSVPITVSPPFVPSWLASARPIAILMPGDGQPGTGGNRREEEEP
jgi:hypothetical protein